MTHGSLRCVGSAVRGLREKQTDSGGGRAVSPTQVIAQLLEMEGWRKIRWKIFLNVENSRICA